MNGFTNGFQILDLIRKHEDLIQAINVMLPELRTLYDAGAPHAEALAALAKEHSVTIAKLEHMLPEIQELVRGIIAAVGK